MGDVLNMARYVALIFLSLAASANAKWIGLAAYGQADCLAKLTNTRLFTDGCHKNLAANGGGSYKADTTGTPPTLKTYASTDCSGTAVKTYTGHATQPALQWGACDSGLRIKIVTAVTADSFVQPVFINAATETGNPNPTWQYSDNSANCGGTPTYIIVKILGMCYWDGSGFYDITCRSGDQCAVQQYWEENLATGKCARASGPQKRDWTYGSSSSINSGTGTGDGRCVVAQKGTKDGNPMPAATEAYIYKASASSVGLTSAPASALTFAGMIIAVILQLGTM